MKNLVFVFFVVVLCGGVYGAIDISSGYWETSFDCPEWDQAVDGWNTVDCDGITAAVGDWYADGLGEQITSSANNPYGVGGTRGQRHWMGDGNNGATAPGSGSLSYVFNSPPSEIWLRFYFRFQDQAPRNEIHAFKLFYIFDPGWANSAYIDTEGGSDFISLVDREAARETGTYGFDDVYGSDISDGSWHAMEIHLKTDNAGATDVFEYWFYEDGVDAATPKFVSNVAQYRFSSIDHLRFPSNHKTDEGLLSPFQNIYFDIDDVAISTSGRIGPIGGAAAVCGNSAVESGETCDDGNTVTESCSYGETSCTVCDSGCQNVAGATSYCGDSTCDVGNEDSSSCSGDCGTPANVLFSACEGSCPSWGGSNVGWVRTVETAGCFSDECLKLVGVPNTYHPGTYGAGSTSVGTATVSGYDEITVQYYTKFSESMRTLSLANLKSIRPYTTNTEYYMATITGWNHVKLNDFYITLNTGTLLPTSIFNPLDEEETYVGDARHSVPNGDGTWDVPIGRLAGKFNQGGYDGFGTQWTKVTQWIKLPSSEAASDGEGKLWINDELAFHFYNVRMSAGNVPSFYRLDFYPSSEAGEAFDHWMDDMVIYEGYVPPAGEPTGCVDSSTRYCNTGLSGICSAGTQTCSSNSWGTCVQDDVAGVEVCGNGIDEDCDGVSDNGCGGGFSSEFYEAEDGVLVSPMAASGGYILTNTGEGGSASYTVNVNDSGNYSLVGNVYAANMDSDSFYVSINGGGNFIWDLNPEISNYNIWRNDSMANRGTGSTTSPQFDPYVFHLDAGNNNILISGREAGARLDYFYLVLEGADGGSFHVADTNQNGAVEFSEVSTYIISWRDGGVSLNELLSAVGVWKS